MVKPAFDTLLDLILLVWQTRLKSTPISPLLVIVLGLVLMPVQLVLLGYGALHPPIKPPGIAISSILLRIHCNSNGIIVVDHVYYILISIFLVMLRWDIILPLLLGRDWLNKIPSQVDSSLHVPCPTESRLIRCVFLELFGKQAIVCFYVNDCTSK